MKAECTAVGLRETARRVDVSATAAYRHFVNKEDFRLGRHRRISGSDGAAMEDAAKGGVELGPILLAGEASLTSSSRPATEGSPDRCSDRACLSGGNILRLSRRSQLSPSSCCAMWKTATGVPASGTPPRSRAPGPCPGSCGFHRRRVRFPDPRRERWPWRFSPRRGSPREPSFESRRSHQILRASSAPRGREAPRREAQGPLQARGLCGNRPAERP